MRLPAQGSLLQIDQPSVARPADIVDNSLKGRLVIVV
jgi:hypothetical protein